MNSEVKATMREALTMLRDSYVEWVSGEWAREKVATIDAALAALDEDAIPTDVLQVAIECIDSERSATANMMDTWKETSDTYKKYAAEIARYETALAWLELRKRPPAQG